MLARSVLQNGGDWKAVIGERSLYCLLPQKVLSPEMACICLLVAIYCLVSIVYVYFSVFLCGLGLWELSKIVYIL